MANKVPFTAYLRIIPNRGNGKRFEIQKSREYISSMVYKALTANLSDANLAEPGGGMSLTTSNSVNSVYVAGCAVKPQFGEFPDLLTITGFYNDSEYNLQPTNEVKVISSMDSHNQTSTTGPGISSIGWKAVNGPTANLITSVNTIKSEIEDALTTNLGGQADPDLYDVTVYAIEYKGVRFGVGGFHF